MGRSSSADSSSSSADVPGILSLLPRYGEGAGRPESVPGCVPAGGKQEGVIIKAIPKDVMGGSYVFTGIRPIWAGAVRE